MALRMAQPWTHPKTKVIYLRQRVPADLLTVVVGTKVSLPVGDAMRLTTIRDPVQFSLGTKDPTEAKGRHAKADAALRAYWTRKRRIVVGENIHDTTPSPKMEWGTAVAGFGDAAGDVLVQHGHPNSDANRAAIIAETARLYDDVAAKLGGQRGSSLVAPRKLGLAQADDRSPQAQSSSLQTPLVTTIKALWDSYSVARKEMLAPKSISRYAPCLASLSAYCGERDIKSITGDDIFRWAEHRRDTDKILPRVVNRNDLMAVKAVFKWATTHQGGKLISSNPAAGIRLDEPRHLPTRERKFREAEINTILRAALDVKLCPTNPSLGRAMRWCPWLAAYTGARIAELTALCAEDIWQEHGVWVMHFNKTKTKQPRMVPVHEHLIEQGFVQMCNAVGSGPLFYDVARRRKADATTSLAENSAKTLAKWVRDIARLDPTVDPNHGWRHTFKSRALGRIDLRFRDHITGHAVGSVGRKYEHPEIRDTAEAMAAFPRYEV